MPGDPKECRQRALNCMLLAKEATTEESKQTFLNLAQSWTRLAVELEDAGVLLKSLSEIELTNAPALESTYRGLTTRVLSQSIERNFFGGEKGPIRTGCLAVCVFHVAALSCVDIMVTLLH